jgi:tRNA (cytidine/uridine-2'-O-)-methyltransferase
MGGVSRTLAYGYDTAGNRASLTHPGGFTITSSYDGLNRLALLTDTSSALVGFSYDAQGRRETRTNYGGAAGGSSYSYDPDGALAGLGHDIAGTSYDYSTTLTRNRAGQIIAVVQANDLYAFYRTAQDRTDTHNGLNQIATLGGTTAVHDLNGNVTTDPGTGAGSTTYSYDQESRLVAASGARNAALSYDPLGRLASLTAGGNTTWFLHDGDRLVGEYDGSGNAVRRYVHGNNIPAAQQGAADEPLIWYQLGDTTPRRWLHADLRGSVVAVTNDSGAHRSGDRRGLHEYIPELKVRPAGVGRCPPTTAWAMLVNFRRRAPRPMPAPMRLALFQPDQAGNVGAAMRLAACFAVPLDVIEPCGFPWGERAMRRAGMDYAGIANVARHSDWEAFLAALPGRLVLLTTRGETPLPGAQFELPDTLLLGSESAGAPPFVHERADLRVRIPLAAGARSLNIAVAAGIALAEALRQTGGWPE